jgi:phosphopantetheinyl transferase
MLSRKMWVQYHAFESLSSFGEPHANDWLSDAERREAERYRDEARLRQWLAGRFVAKQLLNEQLLPWSTDWRDVEILSRDGAGRAVRPVVHVQRHPMPWCVSISHSARGVLVAVSIDPAIRMGVDLAEMEELNQKSLVFWFTARERQRLREGNARRSAVCWAIKEAVYKAVNTGESFVPKKFEVFPRDKSLYECHHEGKSLKGRSLLSVWEVDDHIAVTAIVAESAEALSHLPQLGGKLDERKDATIQDIVLAGIS